MNPRSAGPGSTSSMTTVGILFPIASMVTGLSMITVPSTRCVTGKTRIVPSGATAATASTKSSTTGAPWDPGAVARRQDRRRIRAEVGDALHVDSREGSVRGEAVVGDRRPRHARQEDTLAGPARELVPGDEQVPGVERATDGGRVQPEDRDAHAGAPQREPGDGDAGANDRGHEAQRERVVGHQAEARARRDAGEGEVAGRHDERPVELDDPVDADDVARRRCAEGRPELRVGGDDEVVVRRAAGPSPRRLRAAHGEGRSAGRLRPDGRRHG